MMVNRRVALPAVAGGEPVRDQFLVFGAPSIGEEEIAEVNDTLRSGWIGFGPKCLRFEAEFARYVQSPEAISCSSCTAGLQLALRVEGIGAGDEVITTPLTFVATANVIDLAGARPVFVDVDRGSQDIDPERIEAAVSARTRAILPVHMGGRPCDMDAIEEIARRHGLVVIEDAAHATGASWRGRKIGSISRYTAFSFYATKNLTTAEGGMLTTSDADAARRLRSLRVHGLDFDAWQRYSSAGFGGYDVVEPGFKYNMTDLQASLGLHQLARLDANHQIRERHWQAYNRGLGDLPAVEIPTAIPCEARHALHLYTLLLRLDRLRLDRQQFLEALKAENIGAGVHFIPVHEYAYYRRKYGYEAGTFKNAEEIGRSTVSLPLSPMLTDADVNDVIEAVRKIATYYAR